MGKIIALLALFRAGNTVANPKLWIGGAITVSVLLPVIAAASRVARAYGYNVDISDADAAEIAGGIVALVNCVVHVVANGNVGLPAKRGGVDGAPASAPAAGSDEGALGASADRAQLPRDAQTDVGGTGGVEVRPTDPFVEHGS